MVVSKELFYIEGKRLSTRFETGTATAAGQKAVHVDLRIHSILDIDLKGATFLVDARLEVHWTDDSPGVRDREFAYREAMAHCKKNENCTLINGEERQVEQHSQV